MNNKNNIKILDNCQFLKDLKNTDNEVNRAKYNLIVSVRDLKLYSKGIKPYRGWSINAVKRYFGLKGNTDKVLNDLQSIKNHLSS